MRHTLRHGAILGLIASTLVACKSDRSRPATKGEGTTAAAAIDADAVVQRACGQCHLPREQADAMAPASVTTVTKLTKDIESFVTKHATRRAPPLEALRAFSAGAIVNTLERGTMASIGAQLSAAERVAVAEHLSGKKYEPDRTEGTFCAREAVADEVLEGPRWVGPSNGNGNRRFQPAAGALSKETVSRLKLKWAYALPEGRQGSAIETLGSRVFFGDTAGRVHAIDRGTGCVHWIHASEPRRWVRTALNITKTEAGGKQRYIGSFGPAVEPHFYRGIDAMTGELVWQQQIIDQRYAISSNSPTQHEGTLYIPISVANEHREAFKPEYECCKGRGAIVAVEVATGKVKWTGYTVPEPRPTQKNKAGAQMWGPSGGSVWKEPLVDPKLRRLYVGTGENLSGPQTETAGAIVAMDMSDGRILWSRRLADDVIFNGSCYAPWLGNCPSFEGPVSADASAALLVELAGDKRMLVVANKHGKVWALDPDKDGAILWEKRVGKGGGYGGVQWAMAADAEHIYVPIHDRHQWPALAPKQWQARSAEKKGLFMEEQVEAGSLVALRLSDGREVWRASAGKDPCTGKESCAKAFSSPPAVIPGVVFATSHDGFVRAFATSDGSLLWEFDTAREFETVQHTKVRGGGIDGPGGVTVVDGMVFLSSGYGAYGVMPGNVLLAFSLGGR